MTQTVRALSALGILVLLGGCATTRSYTTLTVPSPAAVVSSSSGKIIAIDGVQDRREFQVDPRDPSIPSLKGGADYQLNAEQRKAAIGRKRNTYGMALGDYQLHGGQTVETLTHDLIATTLRTLGYQIPDGTTAPPGAEHLKVTVNQFWAWMTPGFWTATIEAKLDTQLVFSGASGERSIEVTGYGRNQIQTGREANWQLTYDRAFRDYQKNLQQAMSSSGL
jgi:uncharacterized lipoprotein YajG